MQPQDGLGSVLLIVLLETVLIKGLAIMMILQHQCMNRNYIFIYWEKKIIFVRFLFQIYIAISTAMLNCLLLATGQQTQQPSAVSVNRSYRTMTSVSRRLYVVKPLAHSQ